ncbi:MAG: hypothetical protein WC291_00855 [Thermodesulfovibrionales bacterium]|jgi:hypothetical protein
MTFEFCPNCNERRGFKRAFGWGTFLGFIVILLFGIVFPLMLTILVPVWVLGLIFRYQRCITCGMPLDSARREGRIVGEDARQNERAAAYGKVGGDIGYSLGKWWRGIDISPGKNAMKHSPRVGPLQFKSKEEYEAWKKEKVEENRK